MPTYSQELTAYSIEGGTRNPSSLCFEYYEFGTYYSDGFSITGTGSLASYVFNVPHQGGTDGLEPAPGSNIWPTLSRGKQREQELVAHKLLKKGNVVVLATTSYTCYARLSRQIERAVFLHNPGEILVP